MKLVIGALLIGLLISISMGANQPSFTSLSRFDSTTPANVVSDVIDFCVKSVECLIANYQDFMESNKIVFFIKSSLLPDLPPSTIPLLLGGGLLGLLGYGTWRLIK